MRPGIKALFCILLFCPSLLSAQLPERGLTGTVVSRTDRTPVPGATVVLYQGAEEIAAATTDDTGRFRLVGLVPGDYDLVVNAAQYLETRMGVAVTDAESCARAARLLNARGVENGDGFAGTDRCNEVGA